jgi:hypothetical protein
MQATGKNQAKIRAMLQNRTVSQADHMKDIELGLLQASSWWSAWFML